MAAPQINKMIEYELENENAKIPRALWAEKKTAIGQTYYFNRRTNQTSWENPNEERKTEPEVPIEDDWSEQTTDDGSVYYYNTKTGVSAWTKPRYRPPIKNATINVNDYAPSQIPIRKRNRSDFISPKADPVLQWDHYQAQVNMYNQKVKTTGADALPQKGKGGKADDDKPQYYNGQMLCRDYVKGRCGRSYCRYSHGDDTVPQNGARPGGDLCRDALMGRCTRGLQCKFLPCRLGPAIIAAMNNKEKEIAEDEQQVQENLYSGWGGSY